ncbi:MAG: glycosyltransferase [Roseobacter sp.]
MTKEKRVALFLKSLKGGGMVTSMLRLARGIAERGHRVDVLVAAKPEEAIWETAPANATIVCLHRNALARLRLWQALRSYKSDGSENQKKPFIPVKMPRAPRYLPAVTDYMKTARPDGLIVAGTGYNLTALWARRLSGVQMPVVISERNSLRAEITLHENKSDWLWKHAPHLIAQAYPDADAIVANSYGVAVDLAEVTGLPTSSMTTIFNPVVNSALQEKAREPVNHPWFAPDMPPVILGAGRMHPQKDLPMLVRAFAKLRETHHARLVILGGDAKHGVRDELVAFAAELGVSEDVDLPGFVANPFAFMARAGVFALSSRYEGCPNVLIEALACGCPVVSTRCPHGPDEILKGGEYGALVDVGDHAAMARALATALDQSHDTRRLMERASDFGFDKAVDSYLHFI